MELLMHRSCRGHCCNEHLVMALFQLQGQEFSLGCPELIQTCKITKGFDWGSCLSFLHQLDPGRSLPFYVLTTYDWSEQATASATTINELFLGTSQEPLVLNWISLTWSKQDFPFLVRRWNLNDHACQGQGTGPDMSKQDQMDVKCSHVGRIWTEISCRLNLMMGSHSGNSRSISCPNRNLKHFETDIENYFC